jgi:ActR/RegA family two-component response regulator
MALSGNHELSTLRQANPKAAQRRVKDAVRKAGGNLSAAARELGIAKRTLTRWLAEDENFAHEVRALREADQ